MSPHQKVFNEKVDASTFGIIFMETSMSPHLGLVFMKIPMSPHPELAFMKNLMFPSGNISRGKFNVSRPGMRKIQFLHRKYFQWKIQCPKPGNAFSGKFNVSILGNVFRGNLMSHTKTPPKAGEKFSFVGCSLNEGLTVPSLTISIMVGPWGGGSLLYNLPFPYIQTP